MIINLQSSTSSRTSISFIQSYRIFKKNKMPFMFEFLSQRRVLAFCRKLCVKCGSFLEFVFLNESVRNLV